MSYAQLITIIGDNFPLEVSQTRCWFGNVGVVPDTINSSAITCMMPAQKNTGSLNLSVSFVDSEVLYTEADFFIEILQAPKLYLSLIHI